jgi:C1A family cysteine protease
MGEGGLRMPGVYERRGMGWLPDYPDFRDYTPESDEVAPAFKAASVGARPKKRLPAEVDLRAWCSPVEDQGSLGSCTAHAGVGMIEYFERRALGKHVDASRLFLYKATRDLLQWKGDTGAFLRSAMGALVLFGVPPEQYWPYDIERFEKEPPAFCYAFAQSFQAVKYVRLDPKDSTPDEVLARVKTHLHAGLPSMFGFSVYDSINRATKTGKIPAPVDGEKVVGGHAVMAVGYDDKLKVPSSGRSSTTGALLIRNSWSRHWGDDGYGWLPYEFVTSRLATDWWTLIKSEWTDTGQFGE